ncbi:MAG: uL22 family ribosomal protein [Candidatus Berkelbacteria bacterium]
MEVNVKSKYLRISPRKLRLVINFVRGMNVVEARAKLQFQPNKGAKMIISLLDNAVSVVKTSEISSETFHIAAIACGDGPRLKRGTPVSKGRMAPVVKRQSHMTLTISDAAKADKSTKVNKDKPVKANKETKEPNGTKS